MGEQVRATCVTIVCGCGLAGLLHCDFAGRDRKSMSEYSDNKVISGLEETIQNITDAQHAFAARAFQPVDRSLEAPRDVVRAACRVI